MNSPSDAFWQANSETLDILKEYDEKPERTRFMQFFFYALEEADIYRLAAELKSLNFQVDVSHEVGLGGQWLCLAGMELVPNSQTINRCTTLFLELADRYDATYDGWETRLDLKPGSVR